MRKWLVCILGALAFLNSFSQGNLIWPDSDCFYNDSFDCNNLIFADLGYDGSNAAIIAVIPNSVNISLAGYDTIPAGAYLGVFYTNENNELVCGGINQWPLNTDDNFTISAFPNDNGTNQEEGFENGEEYTWVLRINNGTDPFDGWTDYIGENVIMDSIGQYSPTFSGGGLSRLLSVDFSEPILWTNCMSQIACNYNQAATNSVESDCIYPENEWLNCDGNCTSNYLEINGECVPFVEGCIDSTPGIYPDIFNNGSDGLPCIFPCDNGYAAFNYNPNANISNGNCIIVGCQDANALNYNPNANEGGSGPCDYPIYELDWNVPLFNPADLMTVGILDIDGLEDFGYQYDTSDNFCSDITIGTFYSNVQFSGGLGGSYVDDPFAGYSVGSGWGCTASNELAYLYPIMDDSTTPEKDGFDVGEPLLFIIEINGTEYLMSSNNTIVAYPNAIHQVELAIIEPLVFGCTDENYLEYWDYDLSTASILTPTSIANLDDGSCATELVFGCIDPNASNYNAATNVNNNNCSYEGCTNEDYLEFWSYNPVNSSIELPAIIANECIDLNDDGLPDDLDEDGICDACITLIVEGCTDITAFNFALEANVDDGSCIAAIEGCTEETAFNYDINANVDDGTCVPLNLGCMDYLAFNYNPFVNTDDGTCCYISGCMDSTAFNFNDNACYDDGSCIAVVEGCTNPNAFNYNSSANINNGSCIPFIYGCTDETMWNYNGSANTDDGSCTPFIYGCTDVTALNYNSSANTDDDSCVPYLLGCTDSLACNYNSSANTNDGSCNYATTYYDCNDVCLNDIDNDGVCDELEILGCTDTSAFNYDSTATDDDNSCIAIVEGCMDSTAFNYDSTANTNNGTCCFVSGCKDPAAFNYNSNACYDDGSCIAVVYGCTNPSSYNYDCENGNTNPPCNDGVNIDDGSCEPFIYGCTDPTAFNYDVDANTDFGGLLCESVVEGCTDEEAFNYNVNANTDDNSCIPTILGCTDEEAFNYISPVGDTSVDVNTDDGSCIAIVYGCMDNGNMSIAENDPYDSPYPGSPAANYNEQANIDNGTCFYLVFGCTNPNAFNYNPSANINDGSCVPFIYGCTDPTAFNYDETANTDNESCVPVILGCTNPYYFNYDPAANTDDDSCIPFIYGCTDDGVNVDYNGDGLAAFNYNEEANFDFGGLLCVAVVEGCTDDGTLLISNGDPYDSPNPGVAALNYDLDANTDDGSCIAAIAGCTDATASNYNANANVDDDSCTFPGCTDATAFNYNANANVDNGTCVPYIFGCTDDGVNVDYNGDGLAAFNFDAEANTDFGGLLCEHVVYGCINPFAFNYNSDANTDDGSCIVYVFGCMDDGNMSIAENDPYDSPYPGFPASNYNEDANVGFGGIFCTYLLGCTNADAFNYDEDAIIDDNSCVAVIEGCIDSEAVNYDSAANTDDDSCYFNPGCTDDTAYNYSEDFDFDDNSCAYSPGCTNSGAFNYDSTADIDNGTCCYIGGCTDASAFNFNSNACHDDGSCIAVVYGCTDVDSYNYNSAANTDDDSCIDYIYGCTDSEAINFDSAANTDDGSCIDLIEGCMDTTAVNYNPNANSDDNSCMYYGCTNSDAENYDEDATLDDGSCIIYGCLINAWYICPNSFNPDATINDWSFCQFIWNGCGGSSLDIISSDEYPMMLLSDLTNDISDAYYYLGNERIGCMDKTASNYLHTAVVDDASCIYSSSHSPSVGVNLTIYPQPATTYMVIEILGDVIIDKQEIIIKNILGEITSVVHINKGHRINVNTSNWNPGIYYATFSLNNKLITRKFTVE